MGCMADYSEEDLRLIKSVEDKYEKELSEYRKENKRLHKVCLDSTKEICNHIKTLTQYRNKVNDNDVYIKLLQGNLDNANKGNKELRNKVKEQEATLSRLRDLNQQFELELMKRYKRVKCPNCNKAFIHKVQLSEDKDEKE